MNLSLRLTNSAYFPPIDLMATNPYQPASVSDSSNGDEAVQASISRRRDRRKRWNLRCNTISGLLILLALGTAYLASRLQSTKSENDFLIDLNWAALFMLGCGILAFVFGPISWFWFGQHQR
ncbi:hypothetical protein Rcae01_00835 [Novipirellula caenicola]|uniref:Uncharacterized protein n=1 Tax=Novipirellula caenicola TaxID=1536901 RepID=A0ABP9VLB5_9BACT